MKTTVSLATLAFAVAVLVSACAPGPTGGGEARSPRPKPASSPAEPDQPQPQSTTDWQSLPDVDELRARFGARDDFDEACERERPVREAFEALDAENWSELLRVSTPHLELCPVDIDFHLFRAIALDQMGRSAEALQHHYWRRALVESVLKSGDGRTAETAWVVISVAEEYAVLRALGMYRKQQSLLDGGIDAMVVEVEDGPDQTVYFNPAAHFLRLSEKLKRLESEAESEAESE